MNGRAGVLGWLSSSEDEREAARSTIVRIVHQEADALVAAFYEVFLGDTQSAQFLSHNVVQDRLRHSLRKWLLALVEFDPLADIEAFERRQIEIGEVHARLNIPNNLVMEGTTLIKTKVADKIATAGNHSPSAFHAIILFNEVVDYAIRLMSTAYMSGANRRTKTEEAFRIFSLGQDINLERETQRAALMEWSHSVLLSMLGNESEPSHNSFAASPFGLWIRHRAAVLFQGSPLLDKIQHLIREVDTEILPNISSSQPASLVMFQRRIDEIKFLLNDLFKLAAGVENGRDPLTQTLNRRFLPTVLGREISLSKKAGTPLSVLMVDLDHFKTVNDRFGHPAGDAVLSQTAETILNNVRATDFVFRYGGEEFLIVLVETAESQAQALAERIRTELTKTPISVAETESIKVTASIGVAAYEGHPDYEYLINAADAALYAAKQNGRNCVVVAGDESGTSALSASGQR